MKTKDAHDQRSHFAEQGPPRAKRCVIVIVQQGNGQLCWTPTGLFNNCLLTDAATVTVLLVLFII